MSFKNFSFPVNEETEKTIKELLEKLYQHPKIQEFMNRYDCSFEVIEAHALKFENWIQDLDKIDQLSQEALKKNPELGGYVDLIYDKKTNTLRDEYTYVKTSQNVKKAEKHFENYQIFPLSESLRQAEFSNIRLEHESPSYMKAMQEAIAFSKNEDHGLYLYGNLGVGKSFLAACITNKFAKEGHTVAFVSPADLLAHLKGNFGNFGQDPTLERLKHVSVLVIDDLGAEPITAWGRDEVLLPLLNTRLENFRKTIFTSNYPPKLLEKTYSLDTRGNLDEIRAKRFIDRVLAIAKPIEVSGKNRRRK